VGPSNEEGDSNIDGSEIIFQNSLNNSAKTTSGPKEQGKPKDKEAANCTTQCTCGGTH
jgi:hypothetical protein